MSFLLFAVLGILCLVGLFGGMVVLIRLVHQPFAWAYSGAQSIPPFYILTGIGWALLAVCSAFEVYQSHSLSLFHQLIAGFAGFSALATFRIQRQGLNPMKPTVRLLQFTPIGVVSLFLFARFVDYQMSQAIYQTVREHDYYKLTALRLCGGRLKESIQGKTQLRSDFSMAIKLNYLHWANRMLEAGLDPNMDDTPAGEATSSTLLSEAISRGRTAIVTDLLAHGADPHGYSIQSYHPPHPNWR